MPNRLAQETSPYLLQHAGNPVDWHPWGDEAFALARSKDTPVLLSVGYAACHWCHVMAHESFEDSDTANLMNDAFVCVKVDREERPDIDAIYMRAVQELTGQGGWPMTVFLTPDGAPFYGGTYFPPEDRHGLPAFRRVLASVSEAWRTRREDIDRGAAALVRLYDEEALPTPGVVDPALIERAVSATLARADRTHGGFGGAPKFPPTMTLDFLLRSWARTNDEPPLQLVRQTWDQMVRGGLFDQIGGGFHRYTVDGQWLVPHFEKMLYDNALLVRLGAHLWQVTGDASVREATEMTLAWVEREMTAPEGGFYASLDADSEGHEGRFYVWTFAELREALGVDAELLIPFWGATVTGNFEGRNILWRPQSLDTFAKRRGLDAQQLQAALERTRHVLLAARDRRVRPARDDKIIAGWNGLMLRGVAECARVFGDPRWQAMALHAAEFVSASLVRDGRAFRTFARGAARIPGFLEDHAALGLGFLGVYELTFDVRWLALARTMADACDRHFWDDATGAFFDTAADAPALVARPRDAFDNAIPSGTSLAVELFQRLGVLDGDAGRAARARSVLSSMAQRLTQHPLAFGHLLGAAEFEAYGDISVVIAGDNRAPGFMRLAKAVATRYVPSLVLAGGRSAPPALLEGKGDAGGEAKAYVCRQFHCGASTEDSTVLVTALGDALYRSA